MFPSGGKDYSRGPKEIAGLLYIAIAAVAIWLLGVWWGLGLLAALVAVPAIIGGWREGRRQVRAAAIREGRIRDPVLITADAAERRDVDTLIAALRDPEARAGAAHSLGKLGARRAVPQLIQNLRVHNDLHRNAAVIALGRIGDPAAIPALRELADSDPSAAVRIGAVDSLATLGEPRARAQLGQLAVDPRLIWEGAERYMDIPLLRRIKPSHERSTRRWAAKRVRTLHAVEALPLISSASWRVGPRQRVRLYWTARTLRDGNR